MSFRRVWSRFSARRTTLGPTPGVREAWHQGRRWFAVTTLEVHAPELDALRSQVLAALGAHARPFAEGSPHVTLAVHGFAEPGERPPTANEGTHVEVELGPVNAFASCVFLEARGPLRSLRLALGPDADPHHVWRPHLTLALFNGGPAAPVRAALAPLRRIPRIRGNAELRAGYIDAFSASGRIFSAAEVLALGAETSPNER